MTKYEHNEVDEMGIRINEIPRGDSNVSRECFIVFFVVLVFFF